MATKKLTKQVVDNLEPRTGEYVQWCSNLPGFGCRVRPTGHKSFIVQFRVGGRNARSSKLTIGTYGKVTVEQARTEAGRVLAMAELGENVAAQKAKARAEMSVSQLCDEYLKYGIDTKKQSTIASDRSRIESHIRPLLGRKRLSEVTSAEISRFMHDVAKGKSAKSARTSGRGRSATGGKGTATRTVRLLGGIFTYAVRQGYLKENPRRGVELFKDGRGERFLSREEYGRLAHALRTAETEGLPYMFNDGKRSKHRPVKLENQRETVSPYAIAAIRLLTLTGCRLREILHLKWREVDFDRAILNISDSKTGKKAVLLSKPAMEVLESVPRNGNYVIAGTSPDKPRSDLHRPWTRITAFADLKGLRIHDLRHSYASVGAAAGLNLPVLGKLLGHSSPATTNRYAHLADDPLQRASEEIAGSIAAIMDAKPNATK